MSHTVPGAHNDVDRKLSVRVLLRFPVNVIMAPDSTYCTITCKCVVRYLMHILLSSTTIATRILVTIVTIKFT